MVGDRIDLFRDDTWERTFSREAGASRSRNLRRGIMHAEPDGQYGLAAGWRELTERSGVKKPPLASAMNDSMT